MTHGAKNLWVIFWNDEPKHIKLTTVDIWAVYFTYTLTQTLLCECILKHFLSGHWKKTTNYHLMQVKSIAEYSKGSILQYFWPSLSYHLLLRSLFFVFFEWLLKTGFIVLTTYIFFLFCGVCRLAVRWIFLLMWDFFTTKKDGSTGPTAFESDGPYFEIMGQWPGPTINLKACIIPYFFFENWERCRKFVKTLHRLVLWFYWLVFNIPLKHHL